MADLYKREVLNYLHYVLKPIHLPNLCSSNAYVEQESKERIFHKTKSQIKILLA